MTEPHKPLFTKENWIFFCRELIKTASDKESWFSKKRIMEWIAFLILEWGMIHWLVINISTCKATDLWIWATIQAFICGYQLKQIQNEKALDK